MQNERDRLNEVLQVEGVDLEKVRVMDAQIVSINADRTVNIIVAGVPIFSLPSDRNKVGQVKVLRTHDGRTFVI